MTTTALSFFVEDIAPSRRSFLIGAAAVGSSLVVGFSAFADVAPGAAPAAPTRSPATFKSRLMRP